MPTIEFTPTQSSFPPLNALYPAQQAQWQQNQAQAISNQYAPARNQLLLDTGQESLNFARQKDPLEILRARQELGIDPSPNLDKLLQIYQGGGQTGQAAPSGTFEHQMGRSEAPDATAVNSGGYSGQFQFGAARLVDLGLYKPAPGEDLSKNEWKGTFSIPPYNVTTHQDFLNSPAAQHAAFGIHVGNIDQAIAATPGADKLDPNGLRAVAHLGGVAGMQRFVSSGGAYDPADSNGTHLSDYYKKFAAGGAPALHASYPTLATLPGQAQAAATPAAPVAPAGVAARTGGVDVAGPGAPAASALPVAAQDTPAGPAGPVGNLGLVRNPDGTVGTPQPQAAAPPMPGPASPTNALAPPPVQLQPQAQPPAAAAPQTGLNSPQYQQAQRLLSQATQIEMMAAQTPNDPRVKATAAAMVADLRARAQAALQADSVSVDPATGVQTHTLTGKQDPPATGPTPRAVKDAQGNTWMLLPGGGAKIIAPADPSAVPAMSQFQIHKEDYDRDQKELPAIADAGQQAQSGQIRLQQMRELAARLGTGWGGGTRAEWANIAETLGMPGIAKQILGNKE
jgi:hypothetical protein